jgi:hypothetical protein
VRKSIIALACTAALLGCASRAHLSEHHGRAYQGVFAGQVAQPQAGARPRPMPGLDGQEASIVARNYYQSLATKSAPADDRGILILAPTPGAGQPYVPPPSVPPADRK